MIKMLHTADIKRFCELNPSREYFRLIDEWIYLTPKTPHVVNAYCVFRDTNDTYMQMTEWCDNYQNMFEVIASYGGENSGGWVTKGYIPMNI